MCHVVQRDSSAIKIDPVETTFFFSFSLLDLFELQGIWQASRWLFLLMFGIPTIIISVICYSLCCMDSIDEGDPLEDSDSEAEMQDRLAQEQLQGAGLFVCLCFA